MAVAGLETVEATHDLKRTGVVLRPRDESPLRSDADSILRLEL